MLYPLSYWDQGYWMPSLIGQILTNFTAGVPILLMNSQGYPLESSCAADDLGLLKESKMKKLTSRKLASVLVAGALILGSAVALSASADAAGKQGTSCAKLKSKSGTYTCIANPTTSNLKLIWATANCVSAQAAYLGSVADLATYTKNATNATVQAQSLLASYQNAFTVAQTSLNDIMNTKVFPIDYTPGTRTPSVTAIGFNAAIAAYTAKLATDQAGIDKYTAALAKDVVGSIQAKSDQKSINAFQLGMKSRQSTIDLLKRQVARINTTITNDQTSIATWTSTVNGSIAQQKQLTAQLKASTASAKSTRTLACKAGL